MSPYRNIVTLYLDGPPTLQVYFNLF